LINIREENEKRDSYKWKQILTLKENGT